MHNEPRSLPVVVVRCHGDLSDFLPPRQREHLQVVPYMPHLTAKDVVETVGVPHPEVAALLLDDEAVGFAQRITPGATLDVYPASLAPPVTPLPLRPPLATQRFVLDTHLGRLAAYLRMLGYDTWYANDADDVLLAQLSAEEQRILLTRDQGLLKRSIVVYGAFVRATAPREQLVEVARRYGFVRATRAFTRCLRCNGLLAPVEKEAVWEQLEEETRRWYDTFFQCQVCHRIYWPGSHYTRMQQLISEALGEQGGARDREER